MRHPRKWQLAFVCLLALALAPFLPARRGAAQAGGYTVTDLGTLGGGESAGLGLDACGNAVGESKPAGSTSLHPFYWSGGQMTDLGTFGGLSGTAYAVNRGGQVTGSARLASGEQHPFVWTAAAGKKDLGTLGGSAATAYDINDAGQAVGQSETSPLQDGAFTWQQASGLKAIAAGAAGTPVAAYGVDSTGRVAGALSTPGGSIHAFLLEGGVLTDLGTLGGVNSFAYEVGEGGQVVGYSYVASTTADSPYHGFVYTAAGGMVDLGTLGGTHAIAFDVNSGGQVVGYSETAPRSTAKHAFLWTQAAGLQDLNVLAPGTGWTFQEARGINDRGQIVGTGLTPGGETHAFLLTPSNVGPSPCDATPTPTPTPTPAPTNVSSISGSGVYAGTATLTATLTSGGSALSGRTVSFSLNGTAVCGVTGKPACPATGAGGVATLAAVPLSGVNAGTYAGAVGASFAGDTTYAGGGGTGTLTVGKASAAITLGSLTQTYSGSPRAASATTAPAGLTGLSVTYNGSPTAPTNAGSYAVLAKLNNANYQAADAAGTLVVNKAAPVVTATGNACTYSGAACAGAGTAKGVDGTDLGAVTLTYTPGGALAPTSVGSYTVVASVGATTNHTAGSSAAAAVNITKAGQTITFAALADKTFGDADFAVSATASSGLSVSLSAAGTCTVVGANVHVTGAGTCTVTAAQAGDANYNPAPGVSRSFQIAKAAATVTLGSLSQTFDGTAKGATATTNPAGKSVVITYSQNGQAVASPVGAGSYNVSAAINDANYQGGAAGVLVINKATPALSWSNPPDITFGTALSATQLNATSNVAGTFAYSPAANTVLNAGGGQTLSVTFTPADAGNYNPASKSVAINVSKAAATITLGNLSQTYDGSPKAASATTAPAGLTGLSVTYNGSPTAPTGGGSYAVLAKLANNNYQAADAAGTLVINKAGQTITFGPVPNVTFGAPDFALSATASSGLAVLFSAAGDCTVSGANVHLSGAGGCTVTATQPGDANYNAAPDVQQSFNVARAGQTITFNTLADRTFGDADFALSATASTGLSLSFAAAGQCTVSGATAHLTGAGGCTVTASQAGDEDHAAASVSRSFSISKAATATALSSSLSQTAAGQAVTFTATVTSAAGTPTGSVQFRVDGAGVGGAKMNASGVAVLTTSGLSAGAHAVTADYSGDVNFNPSSGALAGGQVSGSLFEFSQPAYAVTERGGAVSVGVRRTGDAGADASVNYATDDGSVASVAVPCSAVTGLALERCDYTRAAGTLRFAAGETEKSFTVLVGDDSYTEGTETVRLVLSEPGGGAALGAQAAATLQITDDEQESQANPSDDPAAFVRQHYHDFFGREPDAPGLAFWTNQVTNCGNPDPAVCRINVSAAFFLSIEFKETGYLVERMYKAAYGDFAEPGTGLVVPVIRRSEFLADSKAVGDGVVVGQTGWEQVLEGNKNAFALAFVRRQRFADAYASLTPAQFVARLNQNTGGALTDAEAAGLAAELSAGDTTQARASVLRRVAENAEFERRERNRAFVLMQFFGYLQRDPDAAPDSNHTGYQFWLAKLDQFGGNFVRAEMVKAFLSSIEYRTRFAP